MKNLFVCLPMDLLQYLFSVGKVDRLDLVALAESCPDVFKHLCQRNGIIWKNKLVVFGMGGSGLGGVAAYKLFKSRCLAKIYHKKLGHADLEEGADSKLHQVSTAKTGIRSIVGHDSNSYIDIHNVLYINRNTANVYNTNQYNNIVNTRIIRNYTCALNDYGKLSYLERDVKAMVGFGDSKNIHIDVGEPIKDLFQIDKRGFLVGILGISGKVYLYGRPKITSVKFFLQNDNVQLDDIDRLSIVDLPFRVKKMRINKHIAYFLTEEKELWIYFDRGTIGRGEFVVNGTSPVALWEFYNSLDTCNEIHKMRISKNVEYFESWGDAILFSLYGVDKLFTYYSHMITGPNSELLESVKSDMKYEILDGNKKSIKGIYKLISTKDNIMIIDKDYKLYMMVYRMSLTKAGGAYNPELVHEGPVYDAVIYDHIVKILK